MVLSRFTLVLALLSGKGRTKSSVRASRAVSNSCESACSGPALALHLWRSLGSRCDLRLHCATPWHSQKVWNYHSAAVEVGDDCCHQDFYDELAHNGRLSGKPLGPSTAFLPQFGASRRSSVMRTRPFALINSCILAGHSLLLQHRSNALVFCEAREYRKLCSDLRRPRSSRWIVKLTDFPCRVGWRTLHDVSCSM